MLLILLLIMALSLSCTPRLASPQLVQQERFIYGKEGNCDTLQQNTEWWKELQDSTLNALIDSALLNNKDIAIALSRIEEARANLTVVRSQYLPSLSAGVDVGGEYSSQNRGITANFKILPSVSWEVPLFASLRHATQGAKATIALQEWQYRGVKLALVAEVATTYYTLLRYKSSLQIAERSSELRREMVVLIDSLYHYGFASGANLEQAHALLYTAEADIPTYRQAVAESALSLTTLLGKAPCDVDIEALGSLEGKRFDDTLFAEATKVGIPSDILHLRPDVMEAYYTLQQSASTVGLARSARLPSINISASGGSASSDITNLFTIRGWVASMLGSVVQPIFNFRGLKRREVAAREGYRQSLFAYEKCYIEAMADVEKCLSSITSSHEELLRYEELVLSNRNIAIMTYALYRNGLSAYLDVIDAERSLYASQMEYEALVAEQFINYITLQKSIGKVEN